MNWEFCGPRVGFLGISGIWGFDLVFLLASTWGVISVLGICWFVLILAFRRSLWCLGCHKAGFCDLGKFGEFGWIAVVQEFSGIWCLLLCFCLFGLETAICPFWGFGFFGVWCLGFVIWGWYKTVFCRFWFLCVGCFDLVGFPAFVVL